MALSVLPSACSSPLTTLPISSVGYQPTPIELLPITEVINSENLKQKQRGTNKQFTEKVTDRKQFQSTDYYSIEYQHLHLRDLPLLRSMGANCIRLWGWHEV